MQEHHPLFPVDLKAQWHHPSQFSLSHSLLDWLLDRNSLTARLKQHCDSFHISVLGQRIEQCDIKESNEDIKAGEEVLVREVLLYCDGVPQVFARSLLPLTSLTGEQQQLAHLGNQSLGQVLFNHTSLIRKSISLAAFDGQSSVASLVQQLALPLTESMWGRRSVFVLNNKPLMVAEVFLPGSFAYQNMSLSS